MWTRQKNSDDAFCTYRSGVREMWIFFANTRTYTDRGVKPTREPRTHIVSSLPYIHLYVSPQYTSVCKYCRAWFEVTHHKKTTL